MDRVRLRAYVASAVRNVAMLGIGALLVLGFFYHGEFYQLGLPYLLLVGAALVLLIIRMTQWLGAFEMRTPTDGFVIFGPEEVESVLSGARKQTVRLDRPGTGYAPESLLGAKVGVTSSRMFAILRVIGVERKRLGELSREEMRWDGSSDGETFRRKWWTRHGTWDPDTGVVIIRFRVVDPK